ncbi:MAG TPA: efflux transporter outer membrane subunit [Rhizomicrobium sp.]|jgi:NodT family efflux transporter outer membrane factor (OMF) lipoprotein
MKWHQSASVVALALAAAGCSTPVPQVVQKQDVPGQFIGPVVANAQVWPSAGWWQGFGNDELNTLITAAQKNNFDIEVALAQISQAKAQAEIAGAPLYPQISLGADASRSGGHSGSLPITTGTGTGTGGTVIPHGGNNEFSLTLDASYQLDLFGKNLDTLHAAEQAVKSSRFAQQNVALTITSNVATTYMTVLALRERIAIAQSNVDAANRILTVTQAKVTNGVASQLDLSQQQAEVAQVQAQIPALRQQERAQLYSLAVLEGRPPEGFAVAGQNLNSVVIPQVQPGLPSALLERRPDVAEAEANLASAHANVDAARAAFFPQISLTGSGGLASTAVGSLFSGSSFAWTIGGSLLQTVFDGGELQGNLRLNKAEQRELVATYRKSIVSAFSDVETGLSNVSNIDLQEKFLATEVKAASNAFRISELQYREGIIDLTTLLQAQQTLFTAEDALVQSKLALIDADVGLYQVLGGGWSENPQDQSQAIPQTASVNIPASPGTPAAPIRLAPTPKPPAAEQEPKG